MALSSPGKALAAPAAPLGVAEENPQGAGQVGNSVPRATASADVLKQRLVYLGKGESCQGVIRDTESVEERLRCVIGRVAIVCGDSPCSRPM